MLDTMYLLIISCLQNTLIYIIIVCKQTSALHTQALVSGKLASGQLKKKYIPGNLFVVIISLSLYLRLQITSQQVLSLNFKPK